MRPENQPSSALEGGHSGSGQRQHEHGDPGQGQPQHEQAMAVTSPSSAKAVSHHLEVAVGSWQAAAGYRSTTRASSARTAWSSATWASISAIRSRSSASLCPQGQRPWSQMASSSAISRRRSPSRWALLMNRSRSTASLGSGGSRRRSALAAGVAPGARSSAPWRRSGRPRRPGERRSGSCWASVDLEVRYKVKALPSYGGGTPGCARLPA